MSSATWKLKNEGKKGKTRYMLEVRVEPEYPEHHPTHIWQGDVVVNLEGNLYPIQMYLHRPSPRQAPTAPRHVALRKEEMDQNDLRTCLHLTAQACREKTEGYESKRRGNHEGQAETLAQLQEIAQQGPQGMEK